MRESTTLKSVFQLLSLLFCLVMIPVACAQPAQITGAVAEQPIVEQTVAENAFYDRPATFGDVGDNGNYTVHTINPTYNYICVMPGDSDTFNVSFRNEGNETINVAPEVMDVPGSYYVLDKSWIKISPACVSVAPGKDQDFKVEVNVPKDAESGEYQAQIVFTDDVYSNENEDPEYIQDTEPQYVNVMYLGISVPVRPKLELQTSYISDTMQPGKEYVYEIKIKNVAGKDVTIDPEVKKYGYCGSYNELAFSDDIIKISAPSVIKAGEIEKMKISIPVPQNASGYYSGLIEMNADGNENDGSVPQINMDFNVIEHPSAPYVKTFTTTTKDPITITISTDSSIDSSVRVSPEREKPSLEASLKCNSNPVSMTLVETTESSYVYSQWYGFPIWSIEEGEPNYGGSSGHVETYKVSGAVGTWELTILPKNTDSFSCSVTVGDSDKKVK